MTTSHFRSARKLIDGSVSRPLTSSAIASLLVVLMGVVIAVVPSMAIGIVIGILPSAEAQANDASASENSDPMGVPGAADHSTSLPESPHEVSIPWQSLHESKLYRLEPTFALNSGHWHSSNTAPLTASDFTAPSSRGWKGIELGAKLLTDSNFTQTFLLGFDLREQLAWDPSLLTELRLGLHLELRPAEWHSWLAAERHAWLMAHWWPELGVSWFFGDLFRPISRGMQFSGTSWAVSLSKQFPHQRWPVRWGLEYGWGTEAEGGGFIDRGQQDTHRLTWTSWTAVVAFPFAVEY